MKMTEQHNQTTVGVIKAAMTSVQRRSMRINGKIVSREDIDEKIARLHYENEMLRQRLMFENLEFRMTQEFYRCFHGDVKESIQDEAKDKKDEDKN